MAPELTGAQRAFVAALWERKTLAEAAEAAGVKLPTARRYLAQPAVAAEVEAINRFLLLDAANTLSGAMVDAVRALHGIVTSEKEIKDADRIRAAAALLGGGMRIGSRHARINAAHEGGFNALVALTQTFGDVRARLFAEARALGPMRVEEQLSLPGFEPPASGAGR